MRIGHCMTSEGENNRMRLHAVPVPAERVSPNFLLTVSDEIDETSILIFDINQPETLRVLNCWLGHSACVSTGQDSRDPQMFIIKSSDDFPILYHMHVALHRRSRGPQSGKGTRKCRMPPILGIMFTVAQVRHQGRRSSLSSHVKPNGNCFVPDASRRFLILLSG